MKNISKNIILIGMPGSGKSTVGVILAKLLSYDFIDTDVLIQVMEQRPLQAIIDKDGYMALRVIEEGALLSLSLKKHVVSTGGSAVYSDNGMMNLKAGGVCIFLDVTLATIEQRVSNFSTRGIAKRSDQTLQEVFAERKVLYTKYADVSINCDTLNADQVSQAILHELLEMNAE